MDNSTIEMEQFTVGRSEGCDVQVSHPSVNRAHLKIYFTVDTILIEDLDSSTGTYVFHEGLYKRIKSAKIRFDTLVRIGDQLDAVKAQDIIEDFKKSREKAKKDIFKRVKATGFKRCSDCGSVIQKSKIYCDCCGAVFEETA